MKIFGIYSLALAGGRTLSVAANNCVEAFEKMRLLWPVETEGHSWRDLVCR